MGTHWKQSDSPRLKKLINWLRRAPVPETLAGEDLEGNEIRVRVKKDNGKVGWTDVTNAVFKCVKVTALDKEGLILRELELDDPELDQSVKLDDQRRQAAADRALPGREPIISVNVPALVRSIADAMKDVAQTASSQQAAAYTAGMTSMVSVVNLCLSMLQRVDERLADREDDAADLVDQQQRMLLEQNEANQPPTMRETLIQAAISKALGAGSGGGDNGNGGAVDPAMVMKLTSLFQQFTQQGGQVPPAEGSA